jgi:hypothetical protein
MEQDHANVGRRESHPPDRQNPIPTSRPQAHHRSLPSVSRQPATTRTLLRTARGPEGTTDRDRRPPPRRHSGRPRVAVPSHRQPSDPAKETRHLVTTRPSTGRFAFFYSQVSTEDQHDREASRTRQLSSPRAPIEPAGGQIVAEFFDIDRSRWLPWKHRPQAACPPAAVPTRTAASTPGASANPNAPLVRLIRNVVDNRRETTQGEAR